MRCLVLRAAIRILFANVKFSKWTHSRLTSLYRRLLYFWSISTHISAQVRSAATSEGDGTRQNGVSAFAFVVCHHLSWTSFRFYSFGVSRVVYLRVFAQWMLHWCRVSGSTARETFPCTHLPMPCMRLDKQQVPFFKSSVWPGRESNPACFGGACSTSCTTQKQKWQT